MKKITCFIISIIIAISFSACNKSDSDNVNTNSDNTENIVATQNISGDLMWDLSTFEKIKQRSEIVFIGTVKEYKTPYYDAKNSQIRADVTMSTKEILYNKTDLSAGDDISFSTSSCYAPAFEYSKFLSDGDAWYNALTNEDKTTGVVEIRLENSVIIENNPEKEYLIFLRKDSGYGYYPITSKHGVFEIEEKYISQTYQGNEYITEELLTAFRNGAFDIRVAQEFDNQPETYSNDTLTIDDKVIHQEDVIVFLKKSFEDGDQIINEQNVELKNSKSAQQTEDIQKAIDGNVRHQLLRYDRLEGFPALVNEVKNEVSSDAALDDDTKKTNMERLDAVIKKANALLEEYKHYK